MTNTLPTTITVTRLFSPCGSDLSSDDRKHDDCMAEMDNTLSDYINRTAMDAAHPADPVESVDVPQGLAHITVCEVCTCPCHRGHDSQQDLRDSDDFVAAADGLADHCLKALLPFLDHATPEQLTEMVVSHLNTQVPPDLRYIQTGKGDGCEESMATRLRRRYLAQHR